MAAAGRIITFPAIPYPLPAEQQAALKRLAMSMHDARVDGKREKAIEAMNSINGMMDAIRTGGVMFSRPEFSSPSPVC